MNLVEDYICANRETHEQFRAVVQVLSLFVQEHVRGFSLVRLQHETQKPVAQLRQICFDLTQLRLLRRQVGRGERWLLARDAGSVTLEDAYDCLMLAQGQRTSVAEQVGPPSSLKGVKPADTNAVDASTSHRLSVDIVIMQAAMGINQSTRQHLRHFHLDRMLRGAV